MRSVIGEYESLAAAQRAVLGLESRISVQNIVVGDQRKRRMGWRGRGAGDPQRGDFVVIMSGSRENIEHARQLLHPEAPAKNA